MSEAGDTKLRAYYQAKALEHDELALTYESKIPYRRFFYQARFSAVMDAVAPQEGERILELGCGTGYYTRAMLEAGAAVTATDYAANYLNQARELVGEHLATRATFQTEDAQDLSLPDESFDKVLMTEVLEHLPLREVALHECARVLRPQGLLMITTPSRYSPMNLAYGIKRRVRGYDFNEHLHEYTVSGFQRTVREHFAVEDLRFANYLVPYPLDSLFLEVGDRGAEALAAIEAALAQLPLIRRLGWTMILTARKAET